MNIKVTVTVVLPDETWGFSDLLMGRPLNELTIAEIKELILEDYDDIVNPNNWKIEEATEEPIK